jgi:hypothetical protein
MGVDMRRSVIRWRIEVSVGTVETEESVEATILWLPVQFDIWMGEPASVGRGRAHFRCNRIR